MSLFQELKRRRVFRVAGVYLVAAWAIIQASDTIMPRLGLPDWTVTLVIALVALGAPIALILAWAFDVNVDVDRTPSTGESRAFGRIAVVAAVVILSGAGIAFFTKGRAEDLPEGRIAVAVFENRTGDPQLASLGRMTSDFIIRGLSETGQVDVAGTAAELRADDKKNTTEDQVRILAHNADAGVVVTGSVYRENGEVMIVAQVSDARNGKVMRTIGPVKTAEEMRELATGGIVALVSPAGQGFVKIAEGAHLPNWAAYRVYLKGVEAFTAQQYQKCVDAFSKSFRADTAFLLSPIREAYCYQNMQDETHVDSIAAWFESRRERLSAFESAYLDRVIARSHGDLAGVYRASHEMLRLRPNSSNAHYIAGRDAIPLKRPNEAIAEFNKIDPDDPELPTGVDIFRDYALAYHLTGNYKKSLKAAEAGLKRVPGQLQMMGLKATALAALGRIDEVGKIADEIEPQSTSAGASNPGGVLLSIASELYVHGHTEEAKEMAGRAAAWIHAHDRGGAPYHVALMLAGDLAEAERSIAADTSPALFSRGLLAALQGKRDEALRYSNLIANGDTTKELTRAQQLSRLLNRARIAAVISDKPAAMRLLREATASGAGWNNGGHSDVWMNRLAGYKPYDEYMKPRD
ncbi:MAG TPA: hypothetical protein VM100_00570 [Longimicrobiales bacterium]|nr:hypothetical protein [Longimicrobiales bacterium]